MTIAHSDDNLDKALGWAFFAILALAAAWAHLLAIALQVVVLSELATLLTGRPC